MGGGRAARLSFTLGLLQITPTGMHWLSFHSAGVDSFTVSITGRHRVPLGMESVSLALFMRPSEGKSGADPPPVMHRQVLSLKQVAPRAARPSETWFRVDLCL